MMMRIRRKYYNHPYIIIKLHIKSDFLHEKKDMEREREEKIQGDRLLIDQYNNLIILEKKTLWHIVINFIILKSYISGRIK